MACQPDKHNYMSHIPCNWLYPLVQLFQTYPFSDKVISKYGSILRAHTETHFAHLMHGLTSGRSDSFCENRTIPDVPFTIGTSVLLSSFTHHRTTIHNFSGIFRHTTCSFNQFAYRSPCSDEKVSGLSK